MRLSLPATLSLAALTTAALTVAAPAADMKPAVLAGHAVLPAASFVPAPADAPEALQVSGKFTTDKDPARIRAEAGSGATLPVKGQPLQGFSGIKALGDGSYLVLTDNGFGAKANSEDAMLMVHVVKPDFAAGTVEVVKTTFLNDPDKVIPFAIAMEGTKERYLTGSDLDLEGVQPVGDLLFIGEEFGPYLIAVERETGKVVSFQETRVGDLTVQSPDHYRLALPASPDGALPAFNAKRSRGYEGLAASVDGTKLYPLLEGPLHLNGAYETVNGTEALRIFEYDVATKSFTGTWWHYPLEANGNAIGDFNMIDATRGLVIERDNGQGDAELACKDGQTADCHKQPAQLKRITMIDFAGVEPGQPVKKVAALDLLAIDDPNGVARQGNRDDKTFRMPFVTIENVERVDERHILVVNDNNFPFSKGRSVSAIDDTEFVLLEVPDFLAAKAE
ncbi:esterase-like activity of phytase family protein [Chthonobacter rhizosphaerae]|uniref:esterase-like activity of phytase family protein n=1 Tax=Chthonobacter rhizosphaerae TaxID=2735553 RepID=UPI0015EEED48|nr:esterase-like activity of phytase family protein [Chthonobacter rhizosphaerae]